jgi:hypothetical protein
MAAHAMFAMPLLQLSVRERSGSPQWLSEGVASFGLVFVILAGMQVQKAAVPALVGLYIGAAWRSGRWTCRGSLPRRSPGQWSPSCSLGGC